MSLSDHEVFLQSGIDERRASETVKNNKLSKVLRGVLEEAASVEHCNVKDCVNLLYTVASSLPHDCEVNRPLLVRAVASGGIDKIKLPVAVAYLKKLKSDPADPLQFEKECGVGVTVSDEEIKATVLQFLEGQKVELEEQKWQYPTTSLMATMRAQMKFADPAKIKAQVDEQLLKLLGPKGKEEPQKKKKVEPKKESTETASEPLKELITFPDPRENRQAKPELLEHHLQATGGVVVCRFPPEPNGYLHIGHAKSMNLNFSYPKKSGGSTYLRFDDTNPEAEKLEYIESIIDDVKFMGHTPAQITYSSDYFHKLHELAVQLIKVGKAYVCHQTANEIKASREKKEDSPWRNRPIEESLKLFEDMRKGKFAEHEMTLRMKMDMQSDNTAMRDLIAYRIKYTAHPHVGDTWCIYPSYDYTHCIIDSLENISHSLCTLEFGVRRESYYRLLDDLGLYKPLVWEYSRLNITHTVLSKRKLIHLVKGGIVRGWDDPRLPTIRGLRRRGYTAEAINDFCDRIGITRSDNVISVNLLEQCVREDLNIRCNRLLAVLEPLKVTITNFGDKVRMVDAPNYPKDPSKGMRKISMSHIVYIENSDFREKDAKGYKRLAPGKEVGLLHAGCTLICTDFVKDTNGNVTELKATINWEPKNKPQGYINWVSEEAPKVEVRLYGKLFKSEKAGEGDNWLEDINPDSLVVMRDCRVESFAQGVKVGDRFQFERTGYFVLDADTTPQKQVWSRIVSLKEDKWEGKA